MSATRNLLSVSASPDPRHDYLVTFGGGIGPDGSGGHIAIRMVPDRHVLVPESLARYLAALDGARSAEALALGVLDDLLNELVPRWIEVVVSRDVPLHHEVRVDDRQPDWIPAGLPRP